MCRNRCNGNLGRGLAIVYNYNFKVTEEKFFETPSFEAVIWKLELNQI